MFKTTQGFASFSVNDIEQARKFYSQTLNLEVTDQMGGLELHVPGNIPIFIYPKPDHQPATFTVLNFIVDNIEEAVDALAGAGIKFEQYDSQYMKTDSKGISRGDGSNGPTAMAWLKDPAGNFLSLIQK
jgi:catechol 2,3-dioxygenase-like lactoylglutathione lyase family enzyme